MSQSHRSPAPPAHRVPRRARLVRGGCRARLLRPGRAASTGCPASRTSSRRSRPAHRPGHRAHRERRVRDRAAGPGPARGIGRDQSWARSSCPSGCASRRCPGQRLEDIERVYSHVQALGQAEAFLRSRAVEPARGDQHRGLRQDDRGPRRSTARRRCCRRAPPPCSASRSSPATSRASRATAPGSWSSRRPASSVAADARSRDALHAPGRGAQRARHARAGAAACSRTTGST